MLQGFCIQILLHYEGILLCNTAGHSPAYYYVMLFYCPVCSWQSKWDGKESKVNVKTSNEKTDRDKDSVSTLMI